MAKLSSKRVAKEKAEELSAEYYDSGTPIPIERIAEDQGISIIYHNLPPDVSGFLIVKHHKPVIVINNNHSEVRQRFTLAHEIGHYRLHFDETEELFHRDERSSQGSNRQEIQANTFAAELLMPQSIISSELGDQIIDTFDDKDINKVISLAKKLKVSQQALSIRLEQLGYMA